MNGLETNVPQGWTRREALVASILCFAIAIPSTRAAGLGVGHAAAPSHGSNVPSDELLRIEVGPAIKHADLLRTWIVDRSLEAAKAQLPAVGRHEQWIAVEIGGATYDYRVSAVAMRDGEPLGPLGEPVACRCNSDELLTLVDERIAMAVEELRAVPIAPEVGSPPPLAPEPARTEDLGPVEQHDPVPAEPKLDAPKRMGPLGYSGIAVGVLGAAALGVGIELARRPDEFQRIDSMSYEHSTRRPGAAVAVGGGIVLAAGAVMLVVDLVRRRERSTSVAPMVGLRWAGLPIRGRF